MEPWYKITTPRKEVREGRSFNPDEFAIALEQVVSGKAPADYGDPKQFFSRTCFTRALTEHTGMVLRRLAGKTENTAPVMALITQFGVKLGVRCGMGSGNYKKVLTNYACCGIKRPWLEDREFISPVPSTM